MRHPAAPARSARAAHTPYSSLDFSRLKRFPGEFVDDRLRTRRNDLIWRLPRGDGWLLVYLLLEFQSGVHPFMAARLSTYLDLLYQELLRTRSFVRQPEAPRAHSGAPGARPPVARGPRQLPPVVPIVLYNGLRRWTAPTDLADLILPGPSGLSDYRPRLRYLLIDAQTFDDTRLAGMRNLVAALFRLERGVDPASVRAVVAALSEWLNAPETAELRHSFAVWLRESFFASRLPSVTIPELNDLEEVQNMLSERVVPWTEQWKQQGLAQGLEQGLERGLESERRLLMRQLRRRFGEAAARGAAPLAAIRDLATLEELGEALLDCPDIDAWIARLDALRPH